MCVLVRGEGGGRPNALTQHTPPRTLTPSHIMHSHLHHAPPLTLTPSRIMHPHLHHALTLTLMPLQIMHPHSHLRPCTPSTPPHTYALTHHAPPTSTQGHQYLKSLNCCAKSYSATAMQPLWRGRTCGTWI